MKTLAAFPLALGLVLGSAVSLRAQDPGPSAYKSGESVMGQVSKIDPATKTIEVTASNAGTPMTLEYQAKDANELAKFHVGQSVSGKLSKDTPPKLVNLKSSDKSEKTDKPKTGADSAAAAGAPPRN